MHELLIAASLVLMARAPAQACLEPVDLTFDAAYGGVNTLFADMNGDGAADLVTIGSDIDEGGTSAFTAAVRFRNPFTTRFDAPVTVTSFGAWDDTNWGRYQFAADVDHDGRADLITVLETKIMVRTNDTGTNQLRAPVAWTTDAFYGDRTFAADVDGDGRADIIAVTQYGVYVRRSTGASFGPTETWASWRVFRVPIPLGDWYFADVNGDGKADAIIIDQHGVYVRLSPTFGTGFAAAQLWSSPVPASHGSYFADVTGDGRADLIAIQDGAIVVRRSTNVAFGGDEVWLWIPPFTGQMKTAFADVTRDVFGGADLIMVGVDKIRYRRSYQGAFEIEHCL